MPGARLTSRDVITRLLQVLPEVCLVSSCGYPTRLVYDTCERPGNFYLVGAMGMAGPIAYGLALARPGLWVAAVDGDASVVMNLGGLTLAGAHPVPLVHIVLDNGVSESTGGQSTLVPADLATVALAAGYHTTLVLRTDRDLDALDGLTRESLPVFVHAFVNRCGPIGERVRESPPELVRRTAAFLADKSN